MLQEDGKQKRIPEGRGNVATGDEEARHTRASARILK